MDIKEVEQHIFDTFGVRATTEEKWNGDDYLVYVFKKTNIMLSMSSYWTDDERNGKEFISFSYESKNKQSGGGRCCDNFDELDKHFGKYIGIVQGSLF